MDRRLAGCMVLVVLGGLCAGLAGVGYRLWQAQARLAQVQVAVHPDPVVTTPGQAFTLEVQIVNPNTVAVPIEGIRLPNLESKGLTFVEARPVPQAVAAAEGEVQLHYGYRLQGQHSLSLSLVLRATTAYRGPLLVQVQVGPQPVTGRVALDVRAVVQTSPSPTATSVKSAVTPTLSPERGFWAVVRIVALHGRPGSWEPLWSGTGTLIDPQGYILTNAHVALPERGGLTVDALQIALPVAEDQPPEPRYYAEVVQADKKLDLAVLRIVKDLNGQPVDPHTLALPWLPLGDSDALHLGDTLTILGYPGIGGDTITLTRGEVSGFTAEPGYGNRAWIKTSATIAGGNSGGPALNARGELVAVPTQVGAGSTEEVVDCRYLADTNGDGVIDEQDVCVPIGGFINALRPINLAKPLIEKALRGEPMTQPTALPTAPASPGTLIYLDDFEDPSSGWGEQRTDESTVGYSDGGYLIQVDATRWLVWSLAGLDEADVDITVVARVVQPTGEGDFGLVCRCQDESNFYAAEVAEDGYFAIWKYQDDAYSALVEWTPLPEDLLAQAQYTLRLRCVGDRLTFYVNDRLLATARDEALTTGDVGLIAGTWDTPGIQVLFDEFAVYRP